MGGVCVGGIGMCESLENNRALPRLFSWFVAYKATFCGFHFAHTYTHTHADKHSFVSIRAGFVLVEQGK